VLSESPRTYDGTAQPPKLRPDGPRWSVRLHLTDAARRNRFFGFAASSIPEGVAGRYRLPDGHEVVLHQDHHGPRMTALGSHLKALLVDSSFTVLQFEFDAEARTLRVDPA
jgi:hypothetical protein